jgi:hypothetical protein
MGRFVLRNLVTTCLILITALVLFPFDSVAQIKLAWDPNTEPDLVGYRVYYGKASRTYGTPIDVGNITTYTLTGLTSGQTYYIAVTSYDPSNESDYSNEVSGTANDFETISSPGVLSGPTSGVPGGSCTYTTGGSSSNLGHTVEYQFDWKGDGTDLSSWGSLTQAKAWAAAGSYNVRARARCTADTSVVSNWSGSLPVTISASAVSCTLATNPSGLQITVDGTNYIAPQTFSWMPGSSHTLSVSTPQSGVLGTRYAYSSWSDGGAQTHTITVPTFSTTYWANFTSQYSLTTSVNPSGGGTVSPSGTNWYNSGQSVSISSTAKPGYSFSGWSGNLSGTFNHTSIVMDSSKNVTANFRLKRRR